MGTETTEKRPKRHIQLKPELRLAEPRLGRLRLLDVLFELPLRSLGGQMTDILERELVAPPAEGARSRPRRTRWVRLVFGFLAGALFLSALGYLIDDQVTQHRQFERTRSALGLTRRRTATVKHDLAVLVHDVALLTAQVGTDSTAWQQDEAQLQAAVTALALTQGAVSQQSSLIGPLHTCLGGVQQALNALAIDNQQGAVAALNSVSASCSAASG